jgi:hypothetical protein
MTTTLAHDRLTGRSCLTFTSKPDPATLATLRAAGWRWSGYRKAWHHPSRVAKVPEGLVYEDAGDVDYAADRADRLDERSDNARVRASAAFSRANNAVAGIPLGQPILVGHHSERRHRAALARSDSAMRTGCEEADKARSLSARAAASRDHQEHLQAPGTIHRRLERLRADLRKVERQQRAPTDPTLLQLRAQVALNEQLLAGAGGIAADNLTVHPGDVIAIKGWTVKVTRVNPKTITGLIIKGGASGMTGKWDKSHLQQILERSSGTTST